MNLDIFFGNLSEVSSFSPSWFLIAVVPIKFVEIQKVGISDFRMTFMACLNKVNYFHQQKNSLRSGRIFYSKRANSYYHIVFVNRIFKSIISIRYASHKSIQEHRTESILLKERWSLIQSGISKKDVKIKASVLYVYGKKHAEISNSTLVRTSSPTLLTAVDTSSAETPNNSSSSKTAGTKSASADHI